MSRRTSPRRPTTVTNSTHAISSRTATRSTSSRSRIGGQVRNQLTVTADAFSETAEEKLEAGGGEAVLSERGEERAAEAEDDFRRR